MVRVYGACVIREVDRFVLTAPLFSWEKEREPFLPHGHGMGSENFLRLKRILPKSQGSDPLFF